MKKKKVNNQKHMIVPYKYNLNNYKIKIMSNKQLNKMYNNKIQWIIIQYKIKARINLKSIIINHKMKNKLFKKFKQ